MPELDLGSVIGPQGIAATVRVGEVQTLAPGETATVENTGTPQDAVLVFGIPKGDAGPGSGDMLAATYDKNSNEIVDDAERLGGKLPDEYAASRHVHNAHDITDGILAPERGGTGFMSLTFTRAAMGLGATSGPVPVECGGTGAITAAQALNNLGALGINMMVRINCLWAAVFDDLAHNPFSFSFENLDGITLTSGVYNQPLQRIEC